MNNKKKVILVLLIFSIYFFPLAFKAASESFGPTYNVSGYAKSSGFGLDGVLVKAISTENTEIGEKTTVTDGEGYYLITGLPNSTYNFSYTKDGFNTGYLYYVIIDSADITNKNITLLDIAPPVINGVDLSTTTPKTGDSIQVTVNATDNIAVTGVKANNIILSHQGGNIWNGSIIAIEGAHSVNVSASDAAGNVAWDNLTSYTATTPDTTKPTINITSPTNGQTFTTSSITVRGTASDNVGLSKVEVKVGTGSWQTASGTTLWNISVTLSAGPNTIYVRANDTSGNTQETSITVTYDPPDTTSPVINSVTLSTNAPKTGDAILVTVDATDNIAVTGVKANDVLLSHQGGNIWNGTIAAIEGTHTVSVSASDAAGNVAWNNLTSYTATTPDTTKPTINITSPTNGQTFTTSSITVRGTASDNVGLSKVEVKVGTGSWQTASGTTLWNISVTLSAGPNTIYVRANDTSGNTQETSITVTYDPPDTTSPVINSVNLDKNTPKAGDSILVTVNATDNVGVTGVKANDIVLSHQSGNIWNGAITAIEGTHTVSVSASDAAGNVAWDNSTSYTATIPTYIPPAPANLASTQGNFWVNNTWQAGAGNVTDSYNISVNGVTSGTTNTYYNHTVGAHGWSNITIWAYNNSGSGSLSSTSVSRNTQVPNNNIILSGIQDSYSLSEGQRLYIDANYSDADGDTGTFTTNSNKTSIDPLTGVLSWTPQKGDANTYNWQITVSDGHGSVDTKSFIVVVGSSTPGTPVNLLSTTGNFWINYTWEKGANTDSFNVNFNGEWTNGSSGTFINKTVGPHGWGNISVAGYNNNIGVLSDFVSQNTQVPNNPIEITNISDSYSLAEGQNLTIDANYFDADGDTGTFDRNFTQGTFDKNTGVLIWKTRDGEEGTYYWQINATDGYGPAKVKSFTVTVSDSSPGVPTNLTNTTGPFWINWTWNSGDNADDYDVLVKTKSGSKVLANIKQLTNLFYNGTGPDYSAHDTRVISVRSHNRTLNVYSDWVNQTTEIANNKPIISNISTNYTVFENNLLAIYPNATDLDGDALTLFGSNITKGVFYKNNGTFLWTPDSSESGMVYYWHINVSDTTYDEINKSIKYPKYTPDLFSTTTFKFTVAVINSTLTAPRNLTYTTGNFWVNYTWSPGNYTDSFKVWHNGKWLDGTTTNTYLNKSVGPHGWSNITVYGYNTSSGQIGGGISQSAQVPDNPPKLSFIEDREVYKGQFLTFSISATDADNDRITFGTNGKGSIKNTNSATGVYTWTPQDDDVGRQDNNVRNYTWEFISDDGYGGIDRRPVNITVKNPLWDLDIKFIEPTIVNGNMTWVDANVGHVGKRIGYNATYKNRGEDSLILDIGEIFNNKLHDDFTVTVAKNDSRSCPDVPGGVITGCRLSFYIDSNGINYAQSDEGIFNFTLRINVTGKHGSVNYNYINTTTIPLNVKPIYKIKRAIDNRDGKEIEGAIVVNGSATTITYILEANSSVNLTDVSIYDPFYPADQGGPYFIPNKGKPNEGKLEANNPQKVTYTYAANTSDLSSYKCEGPYPCIINMATFTGKIEGDSKPITDTEFVEICLNKCYNGTFTPIQYKGGSSGGYSNSPGGGGGGGGGMGPSGEDFNNIERREVREMDVYSKQAAVYAFRAADPVMVVSFESSVSESGVPVAVEILKTRSKQIEVNAPGSLYKYFNVFVGVSGFSKKVSNGVIVYRVDNSWLESNGLDPQDISLYKWQGDSWVEKNTEIAEKKQNYTYYASLVGNFSSFAIAGVKKQAIVSQPLSNFSVPQDGSTENTPGESGNSTVKLSGDYLKFLNIKLPGNILNLPAIFILISGIIGVIYYLKSNHKIKRNGRVK